MSNLNRTKVRREITTTMPSALPLGELAFNSETSELFVGTGTGKIKVGIADLSLVKSLIEGLSEVKADKNAIKELQKQINELVLKAVQENNNAEVVQARDGFDTLHANISSLKNRTTKLERNEVPNLLGNVQVSIYEGNASIVNVVGNQITLRFPDTTTTSSIKFNYPLEGNVKYLFTYDYVTNKASLNRCKVLKDYWRTDNECLPKTPVIFVNPSQADEGTLVLRGTGIKANSEVTISVYMYANPNNNVYLDASVLKDYKNPQLVNQDISLMDKSKSVFEGNNITPYYHTRLEFDKGCAGFHYLQGVPILRVGQKYFAVAYFSQHTGSTIPGNVDFNTITQGTWDKNIFTQAVYHKNDETFFYSEVISPKTGDCRNLALNVGTNNLTNVVIDFYIFKIHNDFEEKFLSNLTHFTNISAMETIKLSTFVNDKNLMDFNSLIPNYEALYEHSFKTNSSYFKITDSIKLYASKKYYIGIKLAKESTFTRIELKTLKSGVWVNNVNATMVLKEHEETKYLECYFTPTSDYEGSLYLNCGGLVLNSPYSFKVSLFEATPNLEVFLNRSGGFFSPILNLQSLPNHYAPNPTEINDSFPYMTHQITTRIETTTSSWFRALTDIKIKSNKRYYVAVNWKAQPIVRGMNLRTITSGVWDGIVDVPMYPRYRPNGEIYYECYFSPSKNANSTICLDSSGLKVGNTYVYDVYIYEISDVMHEYALRPIDAFLSPSLKLADTSDHHFRGKVCSALGDSLTATGSGGHYLHFVKNQLGFSKIKQCGVGGSTVCGTRPSCMWQTGRINDLLLDSDYIIFKGSTNDSGFITVDESEFTIDNCNTDSFVGAYNVALSKIYYKFLKLDKGYYADKGIDYSEVTQVDKPKDIKIYLITTPKTLDKHASKRQIFAEYVRRIGKMWGLPVVDANGEMQMNPFNYPIDMEDKVHYPVQFHYNLAKLIVGKMRQTESFQ